MWWALQTVLITAVMAAMVAAVGRWGRVRPVALHLLWLLVLVRFVLPPVIVWPWPLATLPNLANADSAAEPSGPVPFLRLVGDAIAPVEVPATVAAESGSVASAPLLPALTIGEWLLLGWAITGVLVLIVQLLRLFRMHRMLRPANPPPAWMQEDVEALSRRLRVSPPRVGVSSRLPVPVYWNVGRARLVVPERLAQTLDRDAWQGIFLHELAHHKRKDHWVAWLELTAGCIWWWNPVYWYARQRLREQAEIACDAWVVGEFPEKRRAYADALLHVFESVSRHAEPRMAWSMSADIRLGFERRLKMIYASHVSRRLSAAWLLCGAGLFALVAPAWSLNRPADRPTRTKVAESDGGSGAAAASNVRSELDGILDSVISLEFEDEHIDRICQFLSVYVDVNIILDHRVIEPAPRSVGQQLPGPSGDVAPPPVIPVIPDPKYVTDGMVPYIKLNDVSLQSALDALCRPMNLAYETTPGFIWISSPTMIESETWPLPQTGTGSRLEDAVSSGRISIEFEDEHVSRIVQFVSDFMDVNIVVDARVVTSAPGGRPSPDTSAVVTTGMVPYLKLNNVSLHQALLALLRPLNLAYRLEKDFVWVSSPDLLASESFSSEPIQQPAPESVAAIDAA